MKSNVIVSYDNDDKTITFDLSKVLLLEIVDQHSDIPRIIIHFGAGLSREMIFTSRGTALSTYGSLKQKMEYL